MGIIGLGLAWERLHAPALERLKEKFEIVAVCDSNAEKAASTSRYLDLPAAYDDYKEMLGRPDIEAVLSLVPIAGNFETAAAVMRSGKHLVAEKPFASSPDAARELIALQKKTGVKVMVAENVRYEDETVLIKNLLTAGQIGTPVYFTDNHVVDYLEDSAQGGFGQTDWRQHPEYAGGVIMDSGVHHMARMRYLFGDVRSVFAHGYPSSEDFSPYSAINAMMGFGENITGHYSFFLSGKESQAPLSGLRIFGTQGEIYLEESACGFVNISYKDDRPPVAISYTPGQGYCRELDNFHAALRLGAEIESTPQKAVGDIETVFALMESARTGEVVRPTQTETISTAYVMPKTTRTRRPRVTV